MANEPPSSSGRPGWRPFLFWLLFLCSVFLLWRVWPQIGNPPETIEYSQLEAAINTGSRIVKRLEIEQETAEILGEWDLTGQDLEKRPAPARRFATVGHRETIRDLTALLDEKKIAYGFRLPSAWRQLWPSLLLFFFIAVFIYLFIYRQIRAGGGALGFGKSRAVRFQPDRNKKTFDDVAGVDEARDEVREIIEFLRNPEKFQRLGGRLPKGILLVGSPGTGKTLLAKAIAGEADVPFFSISGSDFVEMFVGVGASRVRDLFSEAKSNSPCIIFLDEIDAVGRRRANDVPSSGSGMETSQTLNAILVEMDGFGSDDNVIVLAATNRPDVLDPALLRPGRFDRRIYVDNPDARGRAEILRVHTRRVTTAEGIDLEVIARMTPTFSGADLENLVNEAALIAAMREKSAVDMECFEEARDKVRFGKEKRSRQMDEEDRRATAWHEAGHALLMRLTPHVTPLHKVTIVPRGRALGATMQLPVKDEYSMGRRRLFGEIVVMMGGRAAEELFLDDVTSGAAMDLQQATRYARAMVCEWGMSEAIGPMFLGASDDDSLFFARRHSEDMARRIDEEARRILDEGYGEAKKKLGEHREDMQLLVDALLEFEMLSRDELDELLRDRNPDGLRARRSAPRKDAAPKKDAEEEKA